ncbi:hypothetical protein V3W47_03015 [Deinococcus sp. YIM 134068]|uniref:hypothetical protein n=1 Tax=Deinococcus lichenicola TaxID=3118910 RepID=UPI002F9265C4
MDRRGQADRLQESLRRHGQEVDPALVPEVIAWWERSGNADATFAELDAALRAQGVGVEGETLARAVWDWLGVSAPRSVALGAGRARLTHLAELHDVALPSRARELGGQFGRERTLVPDLRRARPWLGEAGSARDVLTLIFETEWSGFLALPGEVGPWVYVPSVADLQSLSRSYAALVRVASRAGDAEVLDAAIRLQLRSPEGSLLARLEATDYRDSPPGRHRSRLRPASERVDAPQLMALEEAFWDAARTLAHTRRDAWAARRG